MSQAIEPKSVKARVIQGYEVSTKTQSQHWGLGNKKQMIGCLKYPRTVVSVRNSNGIY